MRVYLIPIYEVCKQWLTRNQMCFTSLSTLISLRKRLRNSFHSFDAEICFESWVVFKATLVSCLQTTLNLYNILTTDSLIVSQFVYPSIHFKHFMRAFNALVVRHHLSINWLQLYNTFSPKLCLYYIKLMLNLNNERL